MIRLVDTTCIAPSGILHDLAKHLRFVVGRGFLEIIHHNAYDFLEQGFIVLSLMREHGITVVLCNVLLDAGVVNACRHGRNQLVEDWEGFE